MALNDTITALGNSIINLVDKKTPIATANTVGMVKPDGSTISIDANGVISSNGGMGGLPIGTIIPVNATSNYVPDGSLPCDGTEYAKSQFNDLWNNYLSTSLLNTCTYAEYQQDIATYGQCGKFAVDTANNKFRVPLIKDGSVIQQALTDDKLGKSYNAGLPNITGSWVPGIRTSSAQTISGAFEELSGSTITSWSSSKSNIPHGFTFDASRSSSIYGNSTTVQPNAVSLRYFVVVANGQINQSMMDWSAWASSLQGKANTDLSNLSDSGKKVIDGQWVAKTQTLSTATAVGTYEIDLSTYLPNDNYNYDINVHFAGYRNSGDTNSNISISSEPINTVYDLNNLPSSMFAFSSFDGNHAECGNFSAILHIGTNRKFYFNIVQAALKMGGLYAYAYRRIGTNQ